MQRTHIYFILSDHESECVMHSPKEYLEITAEELRNISTWGGSEHKW